MKLISHIIQESIETDSSDRFAYSDLRGRPTAAGECFGHPAHSGGLFIDGFALNRAVPPSDVSCQL